MIDELTSRTGDNWDGVACLMIDLFTFYWDTVGTYQF